MLRRSFIQILGGFCSFPLMFPSLVPIEELVENHVEDHDPNKTVQNEDNLIKYIKNNCKKILKNYELEINDKETRSSITDNLKAFLDGLCQRDQIQKAVVICDESNNTPTIDQGELVCDVYVQFLWKSEFLLLRFTMRGESI